MTVEEFLAQLDGVKRQGAGYIARCPAHEDRHQSLKIDEGDGGKLLAFCHAGCTFEEIRAAVRTNGHAGPARPRTIVATYDYTDESGKLFYQTVRYDPKEFRQKRPNGDGWLWDLDGVRRVLYRLPDLAAAPGAPVVIVEGEKDADRLAGLGILATTSPMGAGKWRPEYADTLRGRSIRVIPDNDEPGRAHAADIARSLPGEDVRTVTLPGLQPKGDVSVWLDAGHTVDELRAAIDGAPIYVPPTTGLRFRTAQELSSLSSGRTDWLIRGFLAAGAITEVDGKIKAAGKTTLALHMVRALLEGIPFLGIETRASRVVYVTEQSRESFSDALRITGLDRHGDELLILTRDEIRGTPWPEVVAACRKDEYAVVVFDTIGKLSGVKDENSASDWSQAMNPLLDLRDNGHAVIIPRHDRKGGGDVGDSGRGSSQASGDADIILALRRPEGNQPSNRRVIEALSRYRETPEKIVVELGVEGYVLLGSQEAVASRDAREFLSVALAWEFQQTNFGTSRKRLVELGAERDPKVKEWAIVAAIDALSAEGRIQRTGRGVAGDPFLYSPLSVETEISRSTDRHSALPIEDDYPSSAWADDLAPAQA
jgi:putative DNA primase/helicase